MNCWTFEFLDLLQTETLSCQSDRFHISKICDGILYEGPDVQHQIIPIFNIPPVGLSPPCDL